MKNLPLKPWLLDILAIIAGATLPLAFAPFNLIIFSIISPLLILLCWCQGNKFRAFGRGFLYGVGMFGVGASWIYISIHRYGNAEPLLAGFLTAIFVLALSFFPALQGYFFKRIFHKNNVAKLTLGFASTWVIFEWLRGWVLTGFPWLYLGYSHIDSPLKGYLPLLGVYGASFACAATAGLFAYIILKPEIRSKAAAGAAILLIWLAGFGLGLKPWTVSTNVELKTALVQGNIPQEIKWQPQKLSYILSTYWSLNNGYWDSDLIIWPEAAMPLPLPQGKKYLDSINQRGKEHNTTVLLGEPVQIGNQNSFHNALLAVGATEGHYFKQKLVPFGEYVPLEKILRGIIDFFNLPMSQFIKGPKDQDPLPVKDFFAAPLICYEIAYAELSRQFANNSHFLVTVSDDSWFGSSIGPHQHFQIARVRALETGRYVLRSTNTGITAIIDNTGKVTAQLPQFEAGVLTATIKPFVGATPWMLFGTLGVMILITIAFVVAMVLRNR